MDRSSGPVRHTKDEAMRLIVHTQEIESRLRRLRDDLKQVLDDLTDPFQE